MTSSRSAPMPLDQADGLRRLFGSRRVRVIPVVSNPNMAFGGVMLERLCTAFAERDCHVLVADASERAPLPQDVTLMELRDGIERLSSHVSYLAARGLPVRYVDTHGSTASFVSALMDAAPDMDVIMVHASATDLCRLLGRSADVWSQDARPLLLADDRPSSVTHAYASLKLLTQRAHVMVHDVLLGAAPQSPRASRIAEQLVNCAEHFLAAVVREVLQIDPASDPRDPPPPSLRRWVHACLQDNPLSSRGIASLSKLPEVQPSPSRYSRADLNSWS